MFPYAEMGIAAAGMQVRRRYRANSMKNVPNLENGTYEFNMASFSFFSGARNPACISSAMLRFFAILLAGADGPEMLLPLKEEEARGAPMLLPVHGNRIVCVGTESAVCVQVK